MTEQESEWTQNAKCMVSDVSLAQALKILLDCRFIK